MHRYKVTRLTLPLCHRLGPLGPRAPTAIATLIPVASLSLPPYSARLWLLAALGRTVYCPLRESISGNDSKSIHLAGSHDCSLRPPGNCFIRQLDPRLAVARCVGDPMPVRVYHCTFIYCVGTKASKLSLYLGVGEERERKGQSVAPVHCPLDHTALTCRVECAVGSPSSDTAPQRA